MLFKACVFTNSFLVQGKVHKAKMSKITMGSGCVLLRFETQAAVYPVPMRLWLEKSMHIAEEEGKNRSFQPRLTPIRKAVQNPFDLLNNTQNTKARSKPQNRSFQKGTKCSHYAKNSGERIPTSPPSQLRRVTLPSYFSSLSPNPTPFLSQPFHGERKALLL